MNHARIDWLTANQRYLVAAVAAIRVALERRLDRADADPGPSAATADDDLLSGPRMDPPPPLDHLCAAFGLSSFEREILLLCTGVELDARLPELLGALHGSKGPAAPTFSLALATLEDAHWTALTPNRPLRARHLVELGPSDTLVHASLRLDEQILHYLTGVADLDPRLACVVEPATTASEPSPSQRATVDQLAEALMTGDVLVQLNGATPAQRRSVAAAACARLGRTLMMLGPGNVPTTSAERAMFLWLWPREARLHRMDLWIELDDGAADLSATLALTERLEGAVLLSSRSPTRAAHRPTIHIDVPRTPPHERSAWWQAALGAEAPAHAEAVRAVVAHFDLEPTQMAGALARALPARDDPPRFRATLWQACRDQTQPRLDDLAQRLQSDIRLDQLVLTDEQLQLLRGVVASIRQRSRVHDDWAFARPAARGLGTTVLFAGASGTGKTTAAEALACELELDLFRIDLSQIVSKYIGETEKNLRRVFDAADAANVVLLFDEADAIFGKRSEVRDSHDRYANQEISYLLQRMESYRGLAVLTTNMRKALDPAFARRIRYVVPFPAPTLEQRARIWRGAFPSNTPVDGLNFTRLAQLNVTGGHIVSIALNAAYLAADAEQPVRMTHILDAARNECSKLERPLTAAETLGWI